MLSTTTIRHGFLTGVLILFFAYSLAVQARHEGNADDAVAVELEHTLYSLMSLAGERPANLVPLLSFYQDRDYRPVWYVAGGVSSAARRWLSMLGGVEQEGTSGLLMQRSEILHRLDAETPVELAELDLMLTDSFFQYARVIGRGQLDSSLVDPDWHIPQPEIAPAALLEQLVNSGQFEEAVASLLPRHPDYRQLRDALAQYQIVQKSGGWPVLKAGGRKLKPGDSSADVPILRRQLWLTGDLAQEDDLGYTYDAALEQAVIRFQQRHGLQGDGVIGKQTRAALSVSVERRIEQLQLNLERWRWLPRDLGSRYITVNTAAFELQVHDEGGVPLSMRVIVGKKRYPTPVFTAKMRYLIINPYWHVPSRVAVRDLIPKQLSDPDYFQSRGIRVLSGWQPDAAEVPVDRVDWPSFLNAGYLPYKLRQDPGPKNALGRIKFMLPNRFSIYLHDTPARTLFDKPVRTFSAGCVRVEDPLALANYVLTGTQASTSLRLLDWFIRQNETQIIALPEPIPVYVLYQTAWIDENGVLQFRPDSYGHDRRLAEALHRQLAPQRGSAHAGIPSIDAALDLLQRLDSDRKNFKPVKILAN